MQHQGKGINVPLGRLPCLPLHSYISVGILDSIEPLNSARPGNLNINHVSIVAG